MNIETVDVEILLLKERTSRKKKLPTLRFYAKDLNKNRILRIHFYPWKCRETGTLEELGKYTLDIFKENNTSDYWNLIKIRAQLV